MQFKYSLLTASLAAALTLTGCGGGGGDSAGSAKPGNTELVGGGVVITVIDGYLKNTLVCSDINKDGECQAKEIIKGINGKVGLTNEQGLLDIEVTKETEDNFRNYPVITKTLEPYVDYSNIGVKPGIYTVDMDQQYQAMGKQVSFRAPAGAKIASPITDLIVAEMQKGNDLDKAEANVQDMLRDLKQGTNEAEIDLYADYVEIKGDKSATDSEKQLAAKLHKTAQILTETQHQASDDIELDDVINDVVDLVVTEVNKTSEADLNNPDYKPVVPVEKDETGQVTVDKPVANYVAVTNKAKLDALKVELGQQSVSNKTNFTFTTMATIAALFEDKDLAADSYPNVTLTADSVDYLKAHGIAVVVNGNQQLVVSSIQDAEGNSTALAGKYFIELQADDQNTKKDVVGQVKALIQFTVGTVLEVNTTKLKELQESINQLDLLDGRAVDISINIENLFTDNDGDKLTYTVTGGDAGLLYDIQYPVLKITGTPQGAGKDLITIAATDDDDNKDEAVLDFSVAKFIFATDGNPIAIFNPITYLVKTPDGRTVIGTYDPLSGEVFDAGDQLVYRIDRATGSITDANDKVVGSLNEDGTITLPTDQDGGDGNNTGGDNSGSEGDASIMTPEQFKLHGDVLENETITVQAGSKPTVVTISSDTTVLGNLTIKD